MNPVHCPCKQFLPSPHPQMRGGIPSLLQVLLVVAGGVVDCGAVVFPVPAGWSTGLPVAGWITDSLSWPAAQEKYMLSPLHGTYKNEKWTEIRCRQKETHHWAWVFPVADLLSTWRFSNALWHLNFVLQKGLYERDPVQILRQNTAAYFFMSTIWKLQITEKA